MNISHIYYEKDVDKYYLENIYLKNIKIFQKQL